MNNSDNCPNCGAESCYHNKDLDTKPPQWFGIGFEESCKLCGADYQYADPEIKKPLSTRSKSELWQEAWAVDAVYKNGTYMTHEQIAKNREYFESITDAVGAIYLKKILDDIRAKGDLATPREAMMLQRSLYNPM